MVFQDGILFSCFAAPLSYFFRVSYRVFARKYRPQTFEEVIGQDSITTVLRNSIGLNRLAQAYLFVGPRGTGKTSTARILAKALNCQNGPTAQPCGGCDSCVEIAESRSLDVLEIDGASNNGVENIREIRENVLFSPVRGPFKIYIIDEVHMLSSGAFNALLKTLEEPPSHVKFIFATTEIQKVPATISSRCQRFDLKRISPQLMTSHLQAIASKENIVMDENAALAIATAADGALRDAESMLDQAVAFCGNQITESEVLLLFGLTPRQTVADLSALVFEKKTAEALALVAEQASNGRDLARLLGDWIIWLRDVLIQQAKADKTADPAIRNQAICINQSKLLELLDLLADTQSRMKWASDTHLQMDVTIIKAAHLLEQASLDDVLTTLTHLGLGSPDSLPSIQAPPAPPEAPSEKLPLKNTDLVSPEAAVQPSCGTAQELSAAMIWKTVAAETINESPFKFGWLSEAENAAFEGTHLRVCFPKSFKIQFESIFWGDIQSLLEKRLSQKRGSVTRLKIDLVDIPSTLDQTHLESPPENTSLLPPPTDPMEEFKNDPLIRKALEIFKGTIQTASS